jgi:hypothetical protein
MPSEASACSYTSDWAFTRVGLARLVVELVEPRRRPLRPLPHQVEPRPRRASARPLDDLVGQSHDLRGRPVVALQPHHHGLGEAAAEVEQRLRRGARERVDGLVRVADHGQVVAATEPRVEHALLQRRHVLVLVHDEAAVAVAELLGDLRVVLQRGRGVQQQVVEVEQHRLVLELLVGRVELHDLLGRRRDVARGTRGGERVVLRGQQRGLGPLDLAGEVAQRVGLGRQAQAGGGAGDDADLLVDELPPGAADDPRPEVAQLAGGGGVERHGLRAVHVERAQPGAHLPRGALGERDGEDLRGGDVAALAQVGDAVGDRARLAGAGAREHADRAARCFHRCALFRIKTLEQRVHARQSRRWPMRG